MSTQFEHDPDEVVSTMDKLEKELDSNLVKFRASGLAVPNNRRPAIQALVSEHATVDVISNLLECANNEIAAVTETDVESVEFRGPFGGGLLVWLFLSEGQTDE